MERSMERSVECSRYMTDVLENALELRHAADVLVHEHEQRFYEVPPIECSIERSIECPIERSNQGKLVDQSIDHVVALNEQRTQHAAALRAMAIEAERLGFVARFYFWRRVGACRRRTPEGRDRVGGGSIGEVSARRVFFRVLPDWHGSSAFAAGMLRDVEKK